MLEIISPGGFETYFVVLAVLYSSARPPEPHLVADLRERYGITANREWMSELKARHGLELLGE